MSTAAHEITALSSSRIRGDGRHEMLRNVDATLADELSTLHQLGLFYEQHTFDTHGSYADLFAVLLSSCKHLIDISTALVQHIRAHDAALHRQRATCDVLCGAMAQHTSDISALYEKTGGGERVLRAGNRGDSKEREEEQENGKVQKENDVARHHLNEIRSLSSSFGAKLPQPSPRRREEEEVRRPRSMPREAHTDIKSAPDGEDRGKAAAWKHEMERRLDSVEEQLDVLCEHRHHAAFHTNTNANGVHMETFDTWKRSVGDDINDRLAHLTHQVALLEGATKKHESRTRWMELDGEGDVAAKASETSRPIPRKKLETPSESPPAAVTQWLHAELDQREEAWLQVLEEVQEALIANHRINTDARGYGNKATLAPTVTDIARSDNTSTEGTNAVGAVPSRCRAWLADAVTQLLLYVNGTNQTKFVDEVTRKTERTDEQLRDVAARLEVLEVYAPHRYAVATAPPLLGVELEDVSAPHIGVRVRTVYQGYLADRAGLSVGDVIAGVGHQSVQSRAQLYALLAELTREYNAQCRVQIEEGYMRHFKTTASGLVDTSILTNLETSCEDGGGTTSFELDQALLRARAEAASAGHRTGGSVSDLKFRGSDNGTDPSKSKYSRSFYPSSSQRKDLLAQCLPYFELALHVLRDGRLRDVTVLVPPSEALRAVAQY